MKLPLPIRPNASRTPRSATARPTASAISTASLPARPPLRDAQVVGDGVRSVIAARSADRPAGMRRRPAQVYVLEPGAVRPVLVERTEHAQLVLAHLAVVPVAVLHRRHDALDVDGTGDVPADDRVRLQAALQVRPPPIQHDVGVSLLRRLPCQRPAVAKVVRRDLLAEARLLARRTERWFEQRRMD